jgi:hypothetical protein
MIETEVNVLITQITHGQNYQCTHTWQQNMHDSAEHAKPTGGIEYIFFN